MSTQRYRCVAEVPCRSGRLAAVLGVLEDALALGLARLASVPEGDLDGDLVLAHELVADGAADGGDDVLLGVDSLGLLDGVCHDGRLLAAARDAWTDARRHDGFRISFGVVRLGGASPKAKATRRGPVATMRGRASPRPRPPRRRPDRHLRSGDA